MPPPKPKSYRPPVQGGGNGGVGNGNGTNSGNWDMNEPNSPRSPNGFFYPTTPSHSHHYSHNVPSSPNSGHHSGGPAINPYNYQYGNGSGNHNGGQIPYPNREPPIGNNVYNGNHAYGGQYMIRNPGMSKFKLSFIYYTNKRLN